MIITGTTRAGDPDRPNEDWFAATGDILVVLDGATVRTETGCAHDPAWYTRQLGAALLTAGADQSTPLREVLRAAIEQVSDLHRSSCDLTHPGTPSAAVAIVREEGPTVRYLVLGDISLVVETTSGAVSVVSDDRVSHTAAEARAEADRHPIGSDEKAAALLEMKRGELAARNTSGGYWIAAADPSAADHALTGELVVGAVERLGLLSDGAARAVELFGICSWAAALSMVERSGPAALVDAVRAAEDADPEGTSRPRNKRSDDATVVVARLRPRADAGAANTASVALSEVDRRALVEQVLARPNSPGVLGAAPARQ